MAGVAWMIAGVFAWYPFAVTVFAVLSSLGISTKVGTTESDCRGLVAIVTGSNTGVGKSTAAALAANGATVIIASRSLERGMEAKVHIENELSTCSTTGKGSLMYDERKYPFAEHGSLHVRQLDLSDLQSVEAFAKGFLLEFQRLDILVNNAGLNGGGVRESATKQGFNMIWGTNYIGHFHLTQLLLERLKAAPAARIVNLASVMHHFTEGDILQSAVGNFKGSPYSDSKLAMIHLTSELRRQLADTNVTAIAVNPGFVRSDIWRGLNANPTWGALWQAFTQIVALTPAEGAYTSVVAATQPFADPPPLYLVPYWVPSWAWLPFEVVGPFAGARAIKPRLPPDEPTISRKLWDISLSLCSRSA